MPCLGSTAATHVPVVGPQTKRIQPDTGNLPIQAIASDSMLQEDLPSWLSLKLHHRYHNSRKPSTAPEIVYDSVRRPLSSFQVSRNFTKLPALARLPAMRYHNLRDGTASPAAAQSLPGEGRKGSLGPRLDKHDDEHLRTCRARVSEGSW